jgi:hypothetical protein
LKQLVVSVCNRRAPGSPGLLLLDLEMKSPRVPRLPDTLLANDGLTGLAASDRHLFVVAQHRFARRGVSLPSSELFILDRRDLKLLNRYPFQKAADVHSICFSRGDLYAVSTGTDEVIRLRLRDDNVCDEAGFWQLDGDEPRQDVHHLNSLVEYGGELLISGFGKKQEARWSSARSGFILNITCDPTAHR